MLMVWHRPIGMVVWWRGGMVIWLRGAMVTCRHCDMLSRWQRRGLARYSEAAEHVVADADYAGRHNFKCVPGKVPGHKPPSSPADTKAQVWLRPTADGGAAVVLHNPSETAATITVDFNKVPKRSWTATTALKVRDLWAHASLGAATGKFTSSSIPKHGSMFLKLTTQ